MAPGEGWTPDSLRPGRRMATGRSSATQYGLMGSLIARIESILESVLDNLSQACEASIELQSRRTSRNRVNQASTLSNTRVRFPGKNEQEARKFARILLILQLSHDALVSGTVLTKRHIYYQHQELFGKQKIVDDLVDDLALTLAVSRDDLNIVAAAKGIVSGPLTIVLQDGTRLDVSVGDLGTTIPETRSIESVELQNVRWVLIIEKEAVFRSLSSCRFWQTSAAGPGLLVTAKGYPDLITLSFLRLLQHTHPQLPLFGLVDYDPDGINIFRCYHYGSETYGVALDDLRMRRLGVKASQVIHLRTAELHVLPQFNEADQRSQSSNRSTTSRPSVSSTACRDPCSQMTCRDRKLAATTLERLSTGHGMNHEADALRSELQIMLMMGRKVEIEWVDEAGSITNWLDHELETLLAHAG